MEGILGRVEVSTMEIGKKGKYMEEGLSCGLMVIFSMVVGRMELDMDLEFIYLQVATGKVYVGTWSEGRKDGKWTFYYPYSSEQPSLLKKLCTVLNRKVSKLRVNPSLSEKAQISHRTFDEGRFKAFGMSCMVHEREYKEGVLITEKIIKYSEKSHNNKNKRQIDLVWSK